MNVSLLRHGSWAQLVGCGALHPPLRLAKTASAAIIVINILLPFL